MSKWEMVRLGDVLEYEQPTKYIVESTNYDDGYKTPVLTAGQSFILGYTSETSNVFVEVPAIIFDDFTTAIKYNDFPFKVKSSAMKILKPTKKAYIKYIFYYMKTIKIDTQLHKRYWISKYADIQAQLPPLEVQRQIADALDKVAALISQRKQQLEQLDLLVKSRFVEMFGDPVTNPMGWEMPCIEDTVAEGKTALKAGPFGSSLKKEYYVESGYKIYGQEQVIRGDVHYGDYYINEEKYRMLQSCAVQANDVLISLVGTYGKLLIIPDDYEPGIINPRLMKISFNPQKINTIYFRYFFGSDSLVQKLAENTHGGTMDILNLGIVRKIKIPKPPLDLQNAFADFVYQTDKSKFEIQQGLNQLELQYSALMQQYFG